MSTASLSSYGTIEGTQIGGDPKGQTQVTLNWSPPTASELHPGEYLGDATGGADSFFVVYDPIAGDPEVYEVTGYTVGGGDTTLSVAAFKGSLYLTVTDPTNFVPNTWIEIEDGSDREYGKVLAVNGSVLTLDTLTVCSDWSALATVKAVDVSSRPPAQSSPAISRRSRTSPDLRSTGSRGTTPTWTAPISARSPEMREWWP